MPTIISLGTTSPGLQVRTSSRSVVLGHLQEGAMTTSPKPKVVLVLDDRLPTRQTMVALVILRPPIADFDSYADFIR